MTRLCRLTPAICAFHLGFGLAKTLGGYGERVEDPQEIVPAIGRAREAMYSGGPALLEFLTKEENALSRYPARAPRALP